MQVIINVLTQIRDSGLLIVPIVLAIAFMIHGITMAIGDHARGKQGMLYAFVGGAVALGSATIATSIHP